MSTKPNQVITSCNHSFDALRKMKALREKPALCDVNIKIGDASTAAHKVVLASSSPYFEFMFTGKVTENGKTDIELKDLCPEAVLALIDYVYSGYLVVNDETIITILKTADFLQITSAKEECLRFLQKNINALNCITIKNLAKQYFFTELENRANTFIRWNFPQVIQSEVFLKLTLDEVKKFLSDGSFCLINSSFQEAVSLWIKYDKSARESFGDDLSTSLTGIAGTLHHGELDLYESFRHKRIYIFEESQNSGRVACIDLNNSTVYDVPNSPDTDKFSCVSVHNSIFLTNTVKGTLSQYDIELEKWTSNQMMLYGIFESRACNVQDSIFLVPADNSNKAYSVDIEKNEIFAKPSLIYSRYYPGVAFNGNCVYVCGGNSKSAERLDIRTEKWRSIAQISSDNLGKCSAVSFGDNIFCAEIEHYRFHQYDPRNGKWVQKATIPNYESSRGFMVCNSSREQDTGLYSTICCTDDTLYAVNKKGIYQYSPSGDVWTTIACSMYTNCPIQKPICLCLVPE